MEKLNHSQEVENDIFKKMANHEQVVFCNDPSTGLRAIIAIHNTTLGPALGGTRMYPYENMDAALEDALRLAEGMTAKCAAADVDFGGGKAVIIGDPKKDKTPALFRAFGQFVDSLNGRFYTGTDMGTTMEDFVHASKETQFINGIPEAFGGGGDSSIPTAQGVIYAIQATNQYLHGTDLLEGRTYSIQGLGKVGMKIAESLLEAGGDVFVTDINQEAIADLVEKAETLRGNVQVVDHLEIYRVSADVFIPCAMGGVLNERTINELRVHAIVGSANNQLAHSTDAALLHDKGILYAPDYIVNAGGLIQVADELYGPSKERVLQKTRTIYHTLLQLYRESAATGKNTVEAAQDRLQRQMKEQQHRSNFFSRNVRPKWDFK